MKRANDVCPVCDEVRYWRMTGECKTNAGRVSRRNEIRMWKEGRHMAPRRQALCVQVGEFSAVSGERGFKFPQSEGYCAGSSCRIVPAQFIEQ